MALQESLVLFLWSYIKQAGNDSHLDLDKLLLLIPKEVLSKHLLINELCRYIQRRLEPFKMFPQMLVSPFERTENPDLDLYYQITPKQSEPEELLEIETNISGRFYRNYSPELDLFIRRPWSDEGAVDSNKYQLWLKTANKDQLLFGEPVVAPSQQDLAAFFERRSALQTKLKQATSTQTPKQPEAYQLSDEEN